MYIFVQQVSAYWSKASRAAQLATARAAVPKALELPQQPCIEEGAVVVDDVVFSETNAFDCPTNRALSKMSLPASLAGGAVQLFIDQDALRVSYRYTVSAVGFPQRETEEYAVKLVPESPVRLHFNGRFRYAEEVMWVYGERCINIVVSEGYSSDLFLRMPPDNVLEDLVDFDVA